MSVKAFSIKSFKRCPTTGFICAKNILIKYNNTVIDEKYLKEINELIKYMQRPTFFKSVLSDFNKIADANKLDFEFLNTLHANTEAKLENSSNRSDARLPSQQNETKVSIYDKYSNDVKFKYMVRQDFTMKGIIKNIKSIFVHPVTAIGVAMWMSVDFGSIVRISYNDFINGDINHVSKTIQNLNANTGLINNFEATTNPLTKEVTMLITTFKEDDIMAQIKDEQLRKLIQNLLDRQNGIIKDKDDNINKLTLILNEERKDAIIERKASLDRFNALMNRTDTIQDTLEETRENLFEAKEDLLESIIDTTNVARDRVSQRRVPNNKQNYIIILKDEEKDPYYIIRIQEKYINAKIARERRKSPNIREIFRMHMPNAISAWISICDKFPNNIKMSRKLNRFSLAVISEEQLITNINQMDIDERKNPKFI